MRDISTKRGAAEACREIEAYRRKRGHPEVRAWPEQADHAGWSFAIVGNFGFQQCADGWALVVPSHPDAR